MNMTNVVLSPRVTLSKSPIKIKCSLELSFNFIVTTHNRSHTRIHTWVLLGLSSPIASCLLPRLLSRLSSLVSSPLASRLLSRLVSSLVSSPLSSRLVSRLLSRLLSRLISRLISSLLSTSPLLSTLLGLWAVFDMPGSLCGVEKHRLCLLVRCLYGGVLWRHGSFGGFLTSGSVIRQRAVHRSHGQRQRHDSSGPLEMVPQRL